MTAASGNHHGGDHRHHHPNQPSTSKPPKPGHYRNPTAQSNHQLNHDPNPNNNLQPNDSPSSSSSPFALSQQDQFLSRATHLTRNELLKRRSHNLKQLSKCYRDYYWVFMEELKNQYKEYYWNYGVSPYKEDHQNHVTQPGKIGKGGNFIEGEGGGVVKVEEVIGENLNSNGSNGVIGGNNKNFRCSHNGCKLKAMALTSYCRLHILSDSKQKLYKPCGFVVRCPQGGPLTCGKPTLKTTPALCSVHFQQAQKHVLKALKKAGLSVSSSSKLAPKLHVIVAEYVRQIQSKRRAAKRVNQSKVVDKEAGDSRCR